MIMESVIISTVKALDVDQVLLAVCGDQLDPSEA